MVSALPWQLVNIAFQFKGIRYTLRATGGSHVLQEDPIDEYIWNYKLYLTAEINGKQTEELLVEARSFDDAMITILFAGDIDRDGKLDLLIDVSNHYNVSSPTLYLSQPAEPGHLLKVVGQHTTIGC